MFVPKSDDSIKVYEQQNAISKDWTLERYFLPHGYALTKLKAFEVHGGDIIVSCAGTIGEIYEIPENAERGVINQALMRVRVNKEIINKKLFIIAFSNMIDNFTRTHSNGSAIKNIPPFADLKPMEALIPPMDEQKKISGYFENLDNLITLHQREFAFLCKEKSKKFRYIKNAWEQRKVSDLLQERNEQTPMSKEYPLMAFIANLGVAPKGERYDRSALVNDEAGKKYKKTEYGDFIYSSNNLEAGSIGLNKYGNACISPVYSIFKPIGKADLDFLGRRFLRKDFINEMVKWRQGVVYGQWKIHESDFLNIEIEVPSVDEQKAIGRYLDFLDHLITLHQRKPNFYTGGYYAE